MRMMVEKQMQHSEQPGTSHTLRYVLGPEDDGVKLRSIVRNRMKVSRRLATRLKSVENGITVNGDRLYMDAVLKQGDIVELKLPVETSETIEPQPMELRILYEDEYLLAVNKPAGLIVHPTLGHYRDTLANGVMHYWQERGERYRFRPVHRLDEQTSGIVVIAKNAYVHQHFSEQLQRQEVEKLYIAIVHGAVREPAGTLTGPIGRDPEQPHLRIVTESGYPAWTAYEVIRNYRDASLVRIRLGTGRTHQIRVHMQWIGHPIIGDDLYTSSEYDHASYRDAIDRQALHANRLAFRHPMLDRRVEIEAPLPEDMLLLQRKLEEMMQDR